MDISATGKAPEKLGWEENDDAAFWKKAIRFVEGNRVKISSNAGKFLPYSPYDREDFTQQAYIAAFEAAKNGGGNGARSCRFEKHFWVKFRFYAARMATDPCLCDVFVESVAGETPDDFCLASAWEVAKERMSKREVKVWKYLLGIAGSKGRLTGKCLAEKLSYNSRQAVEAIRDRGLEKAAVGLKKGALNFAS